MQRSIPYTTSNIVRNNVLKIYNIISSNAVLYYDK